MCLIRVFLSINSTVQPYYLIPNVTMTEENNIHLSFLVLIVAVAYLFKIQIRLGKTFSDNLLFKFDPKI